MKIKHVTENGKLGYLIIDAYGEPCAFIPGDLSVEDMLIVAYEAGMNASDDDLK